MARPGRAPVTSPSRVNDITAAKAMPVEPGATYVFDLAYYDYGWWAALHADGCRIVTRFKRNTPLSVTAERAAPQGGAILPLYSPDLNPIEQLFAKLKHWLRRQQTRTHQDLCKAIADTIARTMPNECANYIHNAGYDPIK